MATSSRRKAEGKRSAPKAAAVRPASRRRTSGPAKRPNQSAPRANWLYPIGLLSVVVVIGAMAVAPWASLSAATDRVEALEGEEAALGAAVEELQAEADRLQDPLELEGPAREDLGLSRPGEVPYIVVNPPTEDPSPVNAPPVSADSGDPESVWERVGDWISDLWR